MVVVLVMAIGIVVVVEESSGLKDRVPKGAPLGPVEGCRY